MYDHLRTVLTRALLLTCTITSGIAWDVTTVAGEDHATGAPVALQRAATDSVVRTTPGPIRRTPVARAPGRVDRPPGILPRPDRGGESTGTRRGPECDVVRTILPDGEVQIRHPDGTVVTLGQGGMTIQYPDGTSRTMAYATVPPISPPPPPSGSDVEKWLTSTEDGLLAEVARLVEADSRESYLKYEASQAGSGFDRVRMRLALLHRLLDSRR